MSGPLIGTIIQAVKKGMPTYFTTEATVKSVAPNPEKTVDIELNTGILIKEVRYTAPVRPAVGSRCLIVFLDNVFDRRYACEFSDIDEIDVQLGTSGSISAKNNAGSFSITLDVPGVSGTKLTLDGTQIQALIGQLSFNVDETNGFVFTGKTQFKDDVKMYKKLDATGPVTLEGVPWKHGHPYNSPSGPATTGQAVGV